MSTFPFDAVIGILMRLPVESLIRFKRLSKECCGLIESSYFINLHKHHSTNSRSNLSLLCTQDIFYGLIKPKIYEVDLPSIENCEVDLNFRSNHELPNCYHESSSSFLVFGVCNGLIAIFDKARGVKVWNPATKQHRELPSFWRHYSCYGWDSPYGYGFGYDVISDEYKLVWTASKGADNGLKVIVYSLKNNSTTTRDCSFGNIGAGRGVHVGGYLHWVDKDNMIVRLEVRDESIALVPVPDEWTTQHLQSLGVLDGMLTVSFIRRNRSGLEIWIMKEYGIKNSWTKLCSIKKLGYLIEKYPLQVFGIKPLCYSKTGNKVLLEINENPNNRLTMHMLMGLCWYDLELKSFEMVRICREEHAVIDLFTDTFVRTLVPLP